MAERMAYLEAVVGADVTAFRRGMQQVRNETGILSETMRGMAGLGRSMTLAFTAPMIALGGAALNTASDFDASMRNINAIAGLTNGELETLSQSVLDFGKNTRSGALEASDALYTVFSAGITSVDDAMAAMRISTMTAEAGLADLTVTTESMVASLLAYGDTSEGFSLRVSDALTQMVAVGVGSMEEFASAMGNVVPTASAMGMSIEELYGNMAFLTQRGLTAAKASTSLNAALTSLAKPTKAMEAAFSQLGVNGAEQLIDKFDGVNGALEALIGTTDGTQASIQALFNNIRGARAINLFAQDIEGWRASMQEFNSSLDGATLRAWEQQMESFAAKVGKAQSALQGAAIVIGNQIMPMVEPLITGFSELMHSVSSLSPEVLQMGVAFSTVIAIAAPLMWLLGSLITPVGVLLGGVAALAVAFAANFGNIRDTVKTAVESVIGDLEPLQDIVDTFLTTLFPEDIDTYDPLAGMPRTEIDLSDTLTVTAPTSLWDIFVAEGYGDYFSWQEFMSAAEAGGWQGGAIEVGDEVTIDMSGLGLTMETEAATVATTAFEGMNMLPFSVSPENVTVDESFRGRLTSAISAIAPDLQAEITRVFDATVAFIDTQGGAALSGIAGWFSGSGATGGNTPVYAAVQALLEGDISSAINAVIPGLGTNLQSNFGANFGQAIRDTFPELSAAIDTLLTNAGDWLVNEGIPTLSRAAGYVMATVGSAITNGISSVMSGLSGDGLAGAGNALGETVGLPFAAGFNDGIANAGGSVDESPFESVLVGIAGGIAALAVTKFALFGGAASAIMFGLNLALAGAKIIGVGAIIMGKIALAVTAAAASSAFSSVAAISVAGALKTAFSGGGVVALLKLIGTGALGTVMSGLSMGSFLFQYHANSAIAAVGGMLKTAMMSVASTAGWITVGVANMLGAIGTGLSTAAAGISASSPMIASVIGAIGSAFSSAATGITAATAWVATMGTTILGAIAAVLTSPISIGLVVGSLLYLAIPDSVKESIRGAFRDLLDGVGGEGTFDGMMVGFEQSMYALMAHLSYFIGNFDGRFMAIGDDFARMVDDNIASRFGLTKPDPLSREWSINPLFAVDTLAIGEEMPELSAQIADALPDDMVISGADFQAILNAQMLLDPTISADIDADFVMQEFTAANFQEFEGIYRAAATDFMVGQDMGLDGLTVDWDNTETTIDVTGFTPALSFPDAESTLSPAEVAGIVGNVTTELDGVRTQIADAISGVSGGGESTDVSGGMTDSLTGNLLDVDALRADGEAYNTELDSTISGFGATVMANIGAGTDLDAQRIIDEFLTPLEGAWVTKFGADSPMASAFTTLSATFIAGLGTMALAQAAFLIATNAAMPAISAVISTALASIMSQAKVAGEAIWNLQAAIGALLSMEGAVRVDINVSGSTSVDGSHSAGLSFVPNDGYIAELHKGERVLTSQEAKAYNSAQTQAIQPQINNTSQSVVNSNQIHIHGAENTDDILNELERRGIKIG